MCTYTCNNIKPYFLFNDNISLFSDTSDDDF